MPDKIVDKMLLTTLSFLFGSFTQKSVEIHKTQSKLALPKGSFQISKDSIEFPEFNLLFFNRSSAQQ